MAQELPPVGVCTKCGNFTSDGRAIDGPCPGSRGTSRCGGRFGSAIGKFDWEECRHCAGTGEEQGNWCPSCQGTGWEYVRGGRRH